MFLSHEVRWVETRDETTQTCAWDAKHFIAELIMYLLLLFQRQRFHIPVILRELIQARTQLSRNYFKQ